MPDLTQYMDLIKMIYRGIGVFYVLYLLGYSTFLFLSVVVGSSELYHRRRQERLKNDLTQDYFIPISIIVPAYNEEVTVEQTVRSLLTLEYPLYEIIVVNDGSKDATAQVVIDAFDLKPIHRPVQQQLKCRPMKSIYQSNAHKVSITLVNKQNGGKADSLNMGINASRYPYFICMDADSILQYDSLSLIVRPVLEDGRVVAVGGAIRPANGVQLEQGRVVQYHMPKKLLVGMQVLEYDRSFLASRILFDKFNGNIIISGAFGLFRKDMVIAAGGYDSSTMGEDMELAVKLHVFCRTNLIPYSIRYAPDAVCWSQAPESLKDLKNQRRRWHIGLMQCMAKHNAIFANPRYGLVSFISYFYFLLYELFSPAIECFGILTVLMAWALQLLNVPFMILFFLIYGAFGMILTLTAFFARTQTLNQRLTPMDVARAVLFCLFEVVALRFAIAFVRAKALFTYRKKKPQSWGRIERKKMDVK